MIRMLSLSNRGLMEVVLTQLMIMLFMIVMLGAFLTIHVKQQDAHRLDRATQVAREIARVADVVYASPDGTSTLVKFPERYDIEYGRHGVLVRGSSGPAGATTVADLGSMINTSGKQVEIRKEGVDVKLYIT